MFKKFLLLTIFIILLSPTAVSAVGVSVKPSKLKIEALVNELTSVSFEVKNPSDIVSVYDVYLDDFSDWIKPAPSSFTLEAGESKKIRLQIKPQNEKIVGTIVSVVTRPLSDRKFQANSGIKVPLEINVITPIKSEEPFLDPTRLIYLIDAAITLIVLALILVKLVKKQKTLGAIRLNMLECK